MPDLALIKDGAVVTGARDTADPRVFGKTPDGQVVAFDAALGACAGQLWDGSARGKGRPCRAAKMPEEADTNSIDRHVGARLRVLRELNGATLEALGKTIGVSLQQINKYESGKNRIAASTMYAASLALGVSVLGATRHSTSASSAASLTCPPVLPRS